MTTSGRPPKVVTSNTVSSDQVDKLRLSVFKTVQRHLNAADLVMQGKKNWDQVQLKLFLSMMDKVLPTLTHNHKTVEELKKPLDQYSNDELLELLERAANAKAITAEIIEAEPVPVSIPTNAPITPTDLAEIEAYEREVQATT